MSTTSPDDTGPGAVDIAMIIHTGDPDSSDSARPPRHVAFNIRLDHVLPATREPMPSVATETPTTLQAG